ncbi:hypothetical protein [Conexibacter sp. SYSU D00693]|uniref:hypothetical protein n=1 Tax=Conexibacter sp. SYSU D00693 TaxID=2812560 RepID=UPI00196B822A|nr:hypothetical protein [Conexibacter sp. SYSU D00693]
MLLRPVVLIPLAAVLAAVLAMVATRAGGGDEPKAVRSGAVPELSYDDPEPAGAPPSQAEIRAAGGNGAFVARGVDLLGSTRADVRRLAGADAHGTQLAVVGLAGERGFFVRAGSGTLYVTRPAGREHDEEHAHEFAAGDVVAVAGRVRRATGDVPGIGGARERAVRERGFWVQAVSLEPVL